MKTGAVRTITAIPTVLLLALLATPLHEFGHWIWDLLVEGQLNILQFTRVTNPDGSTAGTIGSIAAGPLASAIFAMIGIGLLHFSGKHVIRFAGATLALVSSFQRLTIYAISIWKGMAANDEGIVANHFGLFDWAMALPLAAIFIASIVIVWRERVVERRLGYMAGTYLAVVVMTAAGFWLDSIIFG